MVNKITEEDLINKGVIGLPDVPGLTTIEMQKKFDEISRDVIIPRFNELIDNTVSASDEFSKLNTYNVGDYCIYQSVLYKCTTAITTAGEWDATKWKPTSIDKELVALNSNFTINEIEVSSGENYTGFVSCHRINNIVQVTLELTPTSINHGDIFLSGLPVSVASIYISINKINGTVLPLFMQRDGTAIVYYPSDTSVARIDATFMYIAK